jgi:hypothetical protein
MLHSSRLASRSLCSPTTSRHAAVLHSGRLASRWAGWPLWRITMGWCVLRTTSRSARGRRPCRRGLLPHSLVCGIPRRQSDGPHRGAGCPMPRGSVVQGSEDALAPTRADELWSRHRCTPTWPSPGMPMPSRDLRRRCPCHRPKSVRSEGGGQGGETWQSTLCGGATAVTPGRKLRRSCAHVAEHGGCRRTRKRPRPPAAPTGYCKSRRPCDRRP